MKTIYVVNGGLYPAWEWELDVEYTEQQARNDAGGVVHARITETMQDDDCYEKYKEKAVDEGICVWGEAARWEILEKESKEPCRIAFLGLEASDRGYGCCNARIKVTRKG